jgi:hypothetical protein
MGDVLPWTGFLFQTSSDLGTVEGPMTAKEKLRQRIEALTEEEASETLRLLDLGSDPVICRLP